MRSDRVVLLPPPAVSVVGDADPMDCLTDALATGDGNLDLPELVQDLLRAVFLSRHLYRLHKSEFLTFTLV